MNAVSVMVASGKRRQRIGDLLAGTAVGEAGAEVPRPLSSPLLVVYPVGWLVGVFMWLSLAPANDAQAYKQQAQAICQESSAAGLEQTLSAIRRAYDAHAALAVPPELSAVHAELLRSEAAGFDNGREILAGQQAASEERVRAAAEAETANIERRADVVGPYLPACAAIPTETAS